jgi:hypothetical protein
VTNTVANVVSGKPLSTGGVLAAPLATALPTTASAALNAAFKSAGYIGEDGVTETADRSVTKIKAWGGDIVKVVQTEHSLAYKFVFIETLNAEVLKLVHGDARVTVTPATASTGTLTKVEVTGEESAHREWVLEVKDGVAKIRIVIPDGQIIETGDTVYSDEEVIGYEVTVECFNDSNGVKAYKYMDDGVTT